MKSRLLALISVSLALFALGTPGSSETIDFEPPTYVVGPLPAPWTTTGTGPIGISATGAHDGLQCAEGSMVVEGSTGRVGQAEYPISVPAGEPMTITVELMPADYHPGSYDPGYVSHGRFSVLSAAGYHDINVYFEMNKPYGDPVSASHRGIFVQGADFAYTQIGNFLPGVYHHISLTWNWGSSTIDVLVRRPDAVEYTRTVGSSGVELTGIRLRGSEIESVPGRWDDIVMAGPPAPHDTRLRIHRAAEGAIGVSFIPAAAVSYGILYSDAPGGTWKTARSGITGDGESVYDWTDNGSETDTPPDAVSERYYQVAEE